jgi:hypothetical protein
MAVEPADLTRTYPPSPGRVRERDLDRGPFNDIRCAHKLPSMVRLKPRKPIRVWHQSGSDVYVGSQETMLHGIERTNNEASRKVL